MRIILWMLLYYTVAEKQTFAVLFCLDVKNSAPSDRRNRKMNEIRYYNNNTYFRE